MSTNDAANNGGGAGTTGPPTKPTKKIAPDGAATGTAVLIRPWMTTAEVAAESGRHRETVLLALRRKLLKGNQSGAKGHWTIARKDFDDWMSRGKPIARAS
ncbi:helix-turn-helix domain-containing protein [Amycolatopsis kentuckyensis]|uniref:helix-turn-helix domain-containing protein n=1 Tax=Amycolatopsis kentuckyensis TaxID=218823 RepID=UPI003562DA66